MYSSDTVMMSFKAMHNQIRRYMHARAEEDGVGGLSGMQHAVVGYLGERMGQEVFQRDLESAFHMRRSTASGILRLMEKNGLIRREAVERDARLKKLELTDKGAEIRHCAKLMIAELEKRIVKDIAPEELELFLRVVNKMIGNIS